MAYVLLIARQPLLNHLLLTGTGGALLTPITCCLLRAGGALLTPITCCLLELKAPYLLQSPAACWRRLTYSSRAHLVLAQATNPFVEGFHCVPAKEHLRNPKSHDVHCGELAYVPSPSEEVIASPPRCECRAYCGAAIQRAQAEDARVMLPPTTRKDGYTRRGGDQQV